MSTSLRYKLVQSLLRATRLRYRMPRDAAAGRQRNETPRGRNASRWSRSEFDGRAVWICPPTTGETSSVYVHIHGGAYVYGLLNLHFTSLRELADHAGVTVIMPDYPLPPEARAPQMIDWSDRHFSSVVECYGLSNVALGGCSAGANMALAIVQKRASRGEDNPDPVLLWSPWVDLTPADTPPTKADDYEALITPFGLEPAVGAYLGDSGMERSDPLISPANMDFVGCPRLHIVTGERDILFPSIERFAQRARDAGVLADYVTEPEYGHYWMFYPVPDRHPTLKRIAEWLA